MVSYNKREKEIKESEPTPSEKEVVKEAEKEVLYVASSPGKPLIPFAQVLVKAKMEGQLKKFVEQLKKININVPFTEALTQIPSYAKFLKEIISNKGILEDREIMAMVVNNSVVIGDS